MTYPDDDVMHAFHALSQAVGVSIERGKLEAAIPDARAPDYTRWHEVTGEQLDELVSRGWIELIGEDEFEATDQGIYWLKRWCGLREKAERKARRAG